jgi:hypothetical protein
VSALRFLADENLNEKLGHELVGREAPQAPVLGGDDHVEAAVRIGDLALLLEATEDRAGRRDRATESADRVLRGEAVPAPALEVLEEVAGRRHEKSSEAKGNALCDVLRPRTWSREGRLGRRRVPYVPIACQWMVGANVAGSSANTAAPGRSVTWVRLPLDSVNIRAPERSMASISSGS